MSDIKIEKGIPAPRDRWHKYPLMEMEVGDSIWLPKPEGDKIRKAANMHGVRHNREYVSRSTDEGVRLWRIV
jgi:hypothetical protein